MSASLLIDNTTVVTMNAKREVLYNAAIVITGDRIAAIGPAETLRQQYPQAERLDGRGKVVIPGLINAHTHLSMSLQKGVTLACADGLYRVMWPVEKMLTAEDSYIGARVGAAEALKGGTTTAVDHYFYAEQTAKALIELGLRGLVGHTIMSRLGPITGENELEEGIDFVKRWKGKNPLVIPCLAPHATDTVARDWLLRLREVATAEGVRLHLHVAQSTVERDFIRETFKMGCVEYLQSLDFLGPDVLGAHCIFINESEMDLLAKSGTHPLYCPMGHALYGRPAHAWEMMEKGAKVLIGTDCVTSNNEMDIVSELRMVGACQKQLTGDAEAMPSLKILEMVTVDAAEAIGMGKKLGSLTPGYLADLVMLNFSGLHTAPAYSLIDNLIYCCGGRDVDTVMVGGKVVVQGGRLLTADEAELVREIEERGRGLIQRATANDEDLAWLWRSSDKQKI